MIKLPSMLAGILLMLLAQATDAQTVAIEKVENTAATPTTFVFNTIPSNSSTDLANGKAFTLLAGTQNANGPLANLTNGVAQSGQDRPAESFFAADNNNVRIQIDLGTAFPLSQINSYSWHTGVRAPQRYKVYGATAPSDAAPNFTAAAFRNDAALAALGYTLITEVNTQTLGTGGQHGASISGSIGTHRYLLFEISLANTTDGLDGRFGTFFGEIDVHEAIPTKPLVLTDFTYDPSTGNSEVSIGGDPSKAYVLVEAADLDFTNPDQNPVPLTAATVGTLDGNQVITDTNGDATVQFNLGTAKPATFILAQKAPPPPPLVSENFEGGVLPADWTVSDNGNGTVWSVGTPNGSGTEPDAAIGGTFCAGTNMNANYGYSAGCSLVSPAFTVPAGGATLTLSYYIDTEQAAGGPDFGTIRLLNAADGTPLVGGNVATNLQGVTETWSSAQSFALPASANGLDVKLEFAFESDDSGTNFAGFYIDDVTVTAN